MRAVLLIVSVSVEYPALLSTVDCVGFCRIHPAPKDAGILLETI
jgi:hypothetical protein